MRKMNWYANRLVRRLFILKNATNFVVVFRCFFFVFSFSFVLVERVFHTRWLAMRCDMALFIVRVLMTVNGFVVVIHYSSVPFVCVCVCINCLSADHWAFRYLATSLGRWVVRHVENLCVFRVYWCWFVHHIINFKRIFQLQFKWTGVYSRK